MGNSNAISTSKIRKITLIKKNRSEKGNRAEFLGSNPHSNGEDFSRSSIDFFANILANSIIIVDNKIIIVVMIIRIIIIYFVLANFLIGSQIYLLY